MYESEEDEVAKLRQISTNRGGGKQNSNPK
jgi:hypothetical protein